MLFTFYMPFCIHYFIPTSALYAASTQSRDETQKQWCQRHVWQWHCHVQLYMYRVYSRRLWKQLSGEPVLSDSGEEVGAESNWLRLVGEEIFDPRAGGSEHLKVVQFGGSPDGSRWLSPFWGLMVMAPSMDHFAL